MGSASAFWRPFWLLLCVVTAIALIRLLPRDAAIRFEGNTQGTTYHITVVARENVPDVAHLQPLIERRLAEIDAALSNYREDSALSRFNRAPVGEWLAVDRDLYAVMARAGAISADSDGVFDSTIGALVDLWGFGAQRQVSGIPDDAAIAAARTRVDYRALAFDPTQNRIKKQRAVTVDINGIAQGYSVDQLADVLRAQGCANFMVEIGGELRVRGTNPDGQPWRIGIQIPDADLGAAEQALVGTDIGVTTAGDYRDYFERDGTRYSHTIDPRSGRPIAHALASVTVVADDATTADGFDTVLEVLGPDAGFDYAERHGIAAYFIVREGGKFAVRRTTAMQAYLPSEKPP